MNTSEHDCQDLADQVRIFFKTWYPKFWNVTFFCNTMFPSLDNDCAIQDLAFQVLKLFGVKNFNIRPLPRILSFMTWSSKTWTHLEIFFRTWQTKFGNLFFQDLVSQVSKCYIFFCNSMSPSLDNDCTIQDLAFQALAIELRHPIQFQDLAFQALAIELRHPIQFHDLAFQALAIEFVSVPRKG